MDDKAQVIACLVIYSDDAISCQGSFQVFEAVNTNTLESTDGGVFKFTHSYRDMLCDLEVSYSKRGSVPALCNLSVPINRFKIKWKRYDLNSRYTIHYRCQLEDWGRGKFRKEGNKRRRKAAIRGTTAANVTIYYAGGED